MVLGVNLTTIATGTVQANVNSGIGFWIAPSDTFTQIAVSSATNNAITLPLNPILNTTYTIRNDGAAQVQVFPATTLSKISSIAAGGSVGVDANGGVISLICVTQDNTVVNTAVGAAPYNGPTTVWQLTTDTTLSVPIVTLGVTIGTYNATIAQSGTVFIIPAQTAPATINLPAAATSTGVNYKFIAGATVTQTVAIGLAAAANMSGVVWVNAAGTFTPIGCAGRSQVNFLAAALAGDQISLNCDGVRWYVQGFGQAVSFSTTA